jgi:hypothetical protein
MFYKPISVNKNTYKQDAIQLKKICESLFQNKSHISMYSNTQLTPVDIIKARRAIKDSESIGNIFKNIALNSVLNGFERGHTVKSYLSLWLTSIACIDHEMWDISLANITMKSKRVGEDRLKKILKQWCDDEETNYIFESAMSLAGSDASILIEESGFEKTRIIKSGGFRLPFTIPVEFWRSVPKTKIELINPKLLLIDGTIMTLGEINNCLLQSLEKAQPIIIFARGFGEEVIGTLIQNYRMGKLEVLPVILPLGNLSNIIYDIAELTGSDVISTINGMSVSSVKIENLSEINLSKIDRQNMTIFVNKSSDYDLLISKIKNEYKEATRAHSEYSHDIEKSYMERLRFLSNKRVEILLGKNTQTPPGILKDRLQTFFSIYNELVETGIIELNDIKEFIPRTVYKELCDFGVNYIPSASLCYAISTATANQKLLRNTKKILLMDT